MNKIDLNHWYLKENEISISLLRFHVKINILKNKEFIYFQTIIKDTNEQELTFNFYSIEDAISFVEKTVANCKNNTEVMERYETMFENNEFKSPYPNENSTAESTIELTPEEVKHTILEHFSTEEKHQVSVEEELSIHQDHLDLRFYLIEQIHHDGINKDVRTMLTEEDLKMALDDYANFYGYELICFKYIGGIHRVGYYFDEDTPHYDGIQLIVKQKNRGKILTKQNISNNGNEE